MGTGTLGGLRARPARQSIIQQVKPTRRINAHGGERAAIASLYAAKLAGVAMLPAYLQIGAREVIRAEEAAALWALAHREAAEGYAAKAGKVRQWYRVGRAAIAALTARRVRPVRFPHRGRRQDVRKVGVG